MLCDLTPQLIERKQYAFRAIPSEFREFYRDYDTQWSGYYTTTYRALSPAQRGSIADKVRPGIWVGAFESAVTPSLYNENQISHVLNMAIELNYSPLARTTKLGINDGELSPVGVFRRAARVIAESIEDGGNLLVHCAGGISRSVTAVIAYKMLTEGIGFQEALDSIRVHRLVANPHPLLVRSLIRDLGSDFRV